MTEYGKDSWMGELSRKMERFLDNDVPNEALDDANKVVLKALEGLEKVRRKYKFHWTVGQVEKERAAEWGVKLP